MFEYFYHQHTRRAVTVFGTLFNNIQIVKSDSAGKILSQTKVPLSYGPRQKFLSRIRQEADLDDPRLAIKLPRMSFEITAIDYDASTTLQTSNRKTVSTSATTRESVFHPANYTIGFELNILAKHMDDALQILEQIIPYFKPEYTVTVKELDGAFTADMPFVLDSVSLQDDYEGDYVTRRAIVYTLTFTTRVRYYGPISKSGVIRETQTNISDVDMTFSGVPYSTENLEITPESAGPQDEFTITATYDAVTPARVLLISDNPITGTFISGERVTANISGTSGIVRDIDTENDTIEIYAPDERFVIDDIVSGSESGASFTVADFNELWNEAP